MLRGPTSTPHPPPLDAGLRRVNEMLGADVPAAEVLTLLAVLAESFAPEGSAASILALDKDGLLRNAASPRLPADYLDAIDRLKPDADVGTCAAAAATGQIVLTSDFTADAKWAELKHLPLAIGYRSAWSVPIKGAAGTVLGTFGTYFREARTPSDEEMTATIRLAGLAAFALAKRL
jgi:GAF domain-containing protein